MIFLDLSRVGKLTTWISSNRKLHPRKLRCPLKIDGWKMKVPFKMVPFYVTFDNFQESKNSLFTVIDSKNLYKSTSFWIRMELTHSSSKLTQDHQIDKLGKNIIDPGMSQQPIKKNQQ